MLVGIKGPCWLSKYMSIPEQVIFDFMHLGLLGIVKSLLTIWCSSKNHKETWYLGKNVAKIATQNHSLNNLIILRLN